MLYFVIYSKNKIISRGGGRGQLFLTFTPSAAQNALEMLLGTVNSQKQYEAEVGSLQREEELGTIADLPLRGNYYMILTCASSIVFACYFLIYTRFWISNVT